MKRSTVLTRCGAAGFVLGLVGLVGCGSSENIGMSVNELPAGLSEESLVGCHGVASSTVPSSGDYYLTTFGDSAGDDGPMSCGTNTMHGSWYYAASRQRYGCGAHIKITANGKCVIAKTDDYGPDVCVETAAKGPIIDASPLVAKHLFGVTSAGWSEHRRIHVTVVSKTTALGPC